VNTLVASGPDTSTIREFKEGAISMTWLVSDPHKMRMQILVRLPCVQHNARVNLSTLLSWCMHA
jgi:hypothetical protein